MADDAAVQVHSPWERYGWIVQSVWLVFLFFPISAFLGSDQHPISARVLGIGMVVVFAVVYTMGIRRLQRYSSLDPGAALTGPIHLVGLTLIALGTAPIIGSEVLSFLPFIVAFGMFALPLFWGVVTAAVAVVGSGIWAFLIAEGTGLWVIAFITLAVAVMTAGSRFLGEQGAHHDAMSRDLAVVEERERVARDVHDVLGHSLTVVTVKAELAERLLAIDPERARAELADIQILSRQALAEVRATVGGLRVANLSEELAAARGALAGAGIDPDVPTDSAVVDPRHRTVLAWVLREAVTNVVRHSDADACTVTLGPSRLTVADDGRGMEARPEGNGLRGLRERVTAAGGTLTIRTPEAGYGTVLEVRL